MTIQQKISSGLLALAVVVFGSLFISFAYTVPANAQSAQMQACVGSGGKPVDAEGGEVSEAEDFVKCEGKGDFSVESVVDSVLSVLFYVVGIASVIMLIIGGIRYVVSGGDQNAVAGAKNTILYAIVGLVVAFAAFAISTFVINTLSGEEPSSAGSAPTEEAEE